MILRLEARGTDYPVPPDGARLGRDPTLEIVFPDSDDVVSGLHCRVVCRDDGSWWLEDLGSTNGTWLKGVRLGEPAQLQTGSTFSLGQRGPVLRVVIPGQVAKTQQEAVVALMEGAPHLRLRRVKGGEDLVANARDIVLGRSAGCQIPLRTVADTVVSKRHARVTFDDKGEAFLEDLGSRNGTYLNGEPVQAPTRLRPGDRLMLGWQGPMFEVRMIGGAAMPEGEGAPYEPRREPRRSLPGMLAEAEEQAAVKEGGRKKFRTGVFVKAMARQIVHDSSRGFKIAMIVALAVLVVAVVLVYEISEQRARTAQQQLAAAQQQFAERLQRSDSLQRSSEHELGAMRAELEAARRNAVSRGTIDSLEQKLRDAEARAAAVASRPADSGATPAAVAAAARDFTEIARDNGRAVGLVIVRFAADSVMGSGFVITPSGYFVTNRHVIQEEGRGQARQVQVVMAETNVARVADVVAVSSAQNQDVAVLRIRDYHGPTVRSIDWVGHGAEQGAPAALLGFPFGTRLAVDQGGYVHSSLFGGYISQIGEWIRISANTYFGVSGSPVFNDRGEVIAVHFGAPADGPGLGISLPMSRVRRWLPGEARTELGL